ncbi:MAG: polyprenol monophosphomannose synthase [Chloroflexi bacterium HGW-Chloroflexi-1]|nr:MAG: polyprenol monophosphomannose synthase [Chloroflexi bacterium HGW-Chloroflexi-1]
MTQQLSLTVILPTYNERENIPILIERILRAVHTPVQVLVVDDDSPDGTWQVVQEIAAREPRVRLLHRTTERGLTSAIWAGIQAADTDTVSWMDCDLAMPPDVIPALLARLEAGADVALGSRYVPGGSDPGHSLTARAFSVTINLFASLLLGWRVRDYTSGFIAARRAVFEQITLRGDYGEYCIDLLARAQRLGLRVEEAPYACGARFSGESKTGANVGDYVRRGWKYVETVLKLALRR